MTVDHGIRSRSIPYRSISRPGSGPCSIRQGSSARDGSSATKARCSKRLCWNVPERHESSAFVIASASRSNPARDPGQAGLLRCARNDDRTAALRSRDAPTLRAGSDPLRRVAEPTTPDHAPTRSSQNTFADRPLKTAKPSRGRHSNSAQRGHSNLGVTPVAHFWIFSTCRYTLCIATLCQQARSHVDWPGDGNGTL